MRLWRDTFALPCRFTFFGLATMFGVWQMELQEQRLPCSEDEEIDF